MSSIQKKDVGHYPTLEFKTDTNEVGRFYFTGDKFTFDHDIDLTEPVWDDLRVSIEQTQEFGSNPPSTRLFKTTTGTFIGKSIAQTASGQTASSAVTGAQVGFGSTFSLSFWLYGDNFTGTQPLISLGDFYIEWRFSDNIRIGDYGGGDLNAPIINGQRTLVVFTLESLGADNYTANLWLNGSNIDSITFENASMPTYTSDTMTLFGGSFSGRIDALAIWAAALGSSEITALYNNGDGIALAGAEEDLVYAWNFDEGTGTTAAEVNGEAVGFTGVDAWGEGLVAASQSTGVITRAFDPNIQQEVFFSVQLPHGWLEGTDLKPHVHWVPLDGDLGSTDVGWGLEYTWANVGEKFGDTTILYSTEFATPVIPETDSHVVTSLGTMDGTGKKISSMIMCRAFRDAGAVGTTDDYTGEAGLLEIDFHYQKEGLGSDKEYEK